MISMGRRRCFVISPIGPEGSPVREHADDVDDFIIKPALKSETSRPCVRTVSSSPVG